MEKIDWKRLIGNRLNGNRLKAQHYYFLPVFRTFYELQFEIKNICKLFVG